LKVGRKSLSVVLTVAGLAGIVVGVYSGLWMLSSIQNYLPGLILASIVSLWVWVLKPTGKNLPTPPPVKLSNTIPTRLPFEPFNGHVTIYNPLGNDVIVVGGLAGEDDQPYFLPDHVGVAHGISVMPGQRDKVPVTKASRLSAIAARNGDIRDSKPA
jgi:hypothetical protein